MAPEMPAFPPNPLEWVPAMIPAPPVPTWLWNIVSGVLPKGGGSTELVRVD